MPCQHTNRRGDVYYVQVKERAGKPSYSAARKPTGKLVDQLPEGYEIYELPENAQVFVRKIKPTNILPIERQLLESSIRKLAKLEHFIVDVEARSLIVYVTDAEPDASWSILRSMVPMTADQAHSMRSFMLSRARYDKMMRFTLCDAETRQFTIERWHFSGSIDDWYFLDGGAALQTLIEKYVRHLGKESFFELM